VRLKSNLLKKSKVCTKMSGFIDSLIIAALKQAKVGDPIPAVLRARHQQCNVLQVALHVRRHEYVADGSHEGAGGREPAPKKTYP
jgi:hypothetical protein